MRIAYLTNGFPYPLTSGYLRPWTRSGEQLNNIIELAVRARTAPRIA